MGFDGYFAYEFIPTRDPIGALREAVALLYSLNDGSVAEHGVA
jgi:hypothetical protein